MTQTFRGFDKNFKPIMTGRKSYSPGKVPGGAFEARARAIKGAIELVKIGTKRQKIQTYG